MAAARSQETSSCSVSRCSYDVFLSFRGEDTRKTFTDHLYTALLDAGIHTFRDDDELERGENIQSELQKAIEESRISVIVFSKGYASSRWCLDELVQIVERSKASRHHHVLPVFYDVDPSQVRKQTGSFEEGFATHQKRFDEEKLKGWSAALTEVADLEGMVLQNQADGHESKFIQEIVREIGSKLNHSVVGVAPYSIGIDSRVENINLWLQDGSPSVFILMIYGMGGIGKTTIAKTIYNLNFDKFDGSSFLANIREASEQPNGLVCLQEQFLSDILKIKKNKIYNVDEGIIKIKKALCCRRVLLVLDDVDQLDQLNAVLGIPEWFYPGSKIIITTRHKRLLKTNEQYKMHKVTELNDDESFQLFSWHAFGQNHPIEDYMELINRVIKYCGGIPLALEVLGFSLSGRTVDVWESTLEKLEAIPDSQIVEKLKISFDSLQDDHDKNLFLDIACFFIGEDKDFVVTILDGCDFYTKVGIHNLIDRCLLTIDKDNKVTMHQLLRDLGREIIRQESPKEPGKRSRLWHHKDAFNVLEEKSGTETIEGLILNLHVSKEDKPAETFFSVNNAKRHHSEEFLDNSALHSEGNSSKRRRLGLFSWFPINSASTESLSASNGVDLKTDAFSRIHKLRILQLNNVRLTGGYEKFPKKLRWLRWHGFTSKSIPNDFPLESLVALDLCNSSLEEVWKGTKLLKSLKILNLSHSHGLINTPDFSRLPNLESLILEDCINLIEVHESIGELRRLVLLNLEDCKNLRKLPIKRGQLKSLKELILSGCSKLDKLPIHLGKLESLTVLKANRTAINALSYTNSEVKSWRSLFWYWVSKPRESPESISFSLASLSRSLATLSLSNCNLSDDAIPRDFGSLSLLQSLNLSGNPICSLPKSIKDLTILQSFELSHCTRLQSLPELPLSLRVLEVDKCMSLEKVANLPNLLTSLDLGISNCDKLVEVQGLFKLEPIGNYGAEIINKLGLFGLESMGNVEVGLLNNMTLAKRKLPLQGLYEFGILSTFLPSSEVPGWFRNKSIGSSMCFNVPSLPNLKIQGLNICVVYAYAIARSNNHKNKNWDEFCIKISNKSKDLKWFYSPTLVGVPDHGKDMMWLSNWKMGNQLEGGDEVNVSVSLWARIQLKEIGVQVVYEQEEKGSLYNTSVSCQNDIDGGDLSAYQVATGSYFLCHHDFDVHQDCSIDDGWTTTGWYDFLFGDAGETTLRNTSQIFRPGSPSWKMSPRINDH